MSPLFKKLNLGTQPVIHLLDAPASLDPEIALLTGVEVRRALAPGERAGFVLAFAITQARLDALCREICAAAEGDALVWIAYPKQSSRKYRCEFNRDAGWEVLGAAGFEPVRQVAVDEDWSALRFRRVAFIKTLTRSAAMAVSAEGKARGREG